MMLYTCVITLLSPTVISSKRTDRGFFSELKHIPASTIGGAINKHLHSTANGVPNIICSPAYPIVANGKPALPAHPFTYRCKGEERKIFSSLKELGKPIADEIRNNEEDIRNKLIRLECANSHPVKSLYPQPVSLDGGTPAIDFLPLVSVGVNKVTASANIGLLYEYEAIAPGISFRFHAAVLDESININELKKAILRIGRGSSRGLGRARIDDIREINTHDEENKLRTTGVFPMYVLSPLLMNKDPNGELINLIEDKIYLEKQARAVRIVDKIDGILAPAYDAPKFLGSFSRFSMGYSGNNEEPGPLATCMNPGSIVFCRWASPPSRDSLSMVYLKYVGFSVRFSGGFSTYGMGMLAPFSIEPLEEVMK